MIHLLKTDPVYFKEIYEGNKTFELRVNDRDFKEGDIVVLREYRYRQCYLGPYAVRKIGYILKGPFHGPSSIGTAYGLGKGWVIFQMIPALSSDVSRAKRAIEKAINAERAEVGLAPL